MIRLILLGVLSGAFFSSTFMLNQVMSTGGGHWVWSASLRYGFMVLFLALLILVRQGVSGLARVAGLFFAHWRFWVLAGGIGFGGFYALICFSADFSPGWVIAATWQFTIVASLFVFKAFGRTIPPKTWGISLVVFSGVVLVNLTHMAVFDLKALVLGGLPVLWAAFCYPFGNQLVWEAEKGGHSRIPHIRDPLIRDAFHKVFLMSLGSFPLWICLVLVIAPPAPSGSQVMDTALVALFSGICATSIFLYARNRAANAGELAGVDATQSSEVVFALAGGMAFLDTALPGMAAVLGLCLIVGGLTCFALVREQ